MTTQIIWENEAQNYTIDTEGMVKNLKTGEKLNPQQWESSIIHWRKIKGSFGCKNYGGTFFRMS